MQHRFDLWVSACLLAGCTAVDPFGIFTFGDGGTSGDGASDDGGPPDLAPVTCGGALQPCCTGGPACLGGGCCVTGICHPSGSASGAGTVCFNGVSAPCGATGQPCCDSNTCKTQGCCIGGQCFQQGSSCGNNAGINGNCSGGVTQSGPTCAPVASAACGGSNQACCPGSRSSSGTIADYCVASGLACNPASGTCQQCGGPGQSCCDGNFCDGGGCCSATNNFTCLQDGDSCSQSNGKCASNGCNDGACGKIGRPCCPNGLGCTAPNATCQAGTCAPCGSLGESCCPAHGGGFCNEPYVCGVQAVCRRCGDIGEACCAGDSCTGSAKCVAGTCA